MLVVAKVPTIGGHKNTLIKGDPSLESTVSAPRGQTLPDSTYLEGRIDDILHTFSLASRFERSGRFHLAKSLPLRISNDAIAADKLHFLFFELLLAHLIR